MLQKIIYREKRKTECVAKKSFEKRAYLVNELISDRLLQYVEVQEKTHA